MFRFKAHATGFAVASALLGIAGPAAAQSSVSIYGVQDAGITRVSNAAGGKLNLLDAGIMQAGRLGFRGSEDLGGGMSAVFLLEQGILLDTGALGQGGLAFGRQSWVGLSDRRLGTLTLGRQYDFMFDSLVGFINSSMSGGGYANNPLDNDRMSGQRVNNSVKYQSPVWGGFSAGALAAFSEAAGTVRGTGYTRSFGANYKQGALSLGSAYTYLQNASLDVRTLVGSTTAVTTGGSSQRIFGFGGSYQATDKVVLHGTATDTKLEGTATTVRADFRNYQAGVVFSPVPQWRLGVAGNATELYDRHYRQLNLTADYVLSKRTDVYVQLIHQKASGAGATANIFLLPGSSDGTQTALRSGVRVRF